jgi:hypothetical protein
MEFYFLKGKETLENEEIGQHWPCKVPGEQVIPWLFWVFFLSYSLS